MARVDTPTDKSAEGYDLIVWMGDEDFLIKAFSVVGKSFLETIFGPDKGMHVLEMYPEELLEKIPRTFNVGLADPNTNLIRLMKKLPLH